MSLKVLFGNLLHEYAREEGRTIDEIRAIVGHTGAGQFTRWKKGQWSAIESAKLVKLVRATTGDVEKQANLIIAYVVDLIPVEFRPMIDVGLRGQVRVGMNTAEELQGPWSQDVRRRLEVIGKAYSKDADFQRMVDTLVGWGRRINKEE